MAYTTTTLVRDVSGFTTSEISDTDLGDIIAESDRIVLNDISIYHYAENLIGDIDNNNTQFRTQHKPIFDNDYDKDVDASDITVYKVEINNDTGFEESTAVTVTTVNARDGIITLSAAVGTEISWVRADFRSCYQEPDYDLVALAASYKAAEISDFIVSGGTEDLKSVKLGDLSFTKDTADSLTGTKRGSEFRSKYNRLIRQINKIGMRVKVMK